MLSRFRELITNHSEETVGRRINKHIVKQCAMIFVALCIILMLHGLLGGIIVASLGASSCILFLTPHKKASQTKNLIGGYSLAAISGIAFSMVHSALYTINISELDVILIVVCAFAAAVTTLLMVMTRLVHPPSAALALGLAADPHCLRTAVAALAGIVILCVIRRLLGKYMRNLI